MGSDLGDFLGQIPIGPIVMFCGSGILMVIALVAIVQARGRRARDAQNAQASSYVPFDNPDTTSSMDAGDLPDLDMLVQAPPAPTPAPVVAAPPAASPVRTTRKGMYSVNLSEGGSTEAVEVMAILRDVVDGSLMVQMGDKVFRTLANDEAQKNNFLKVMRELATIVKTAPETPAQPEVQEPDPVEEEPSSLRDLVESPAAHVQEPPKVTPRPAPAPTGVPLPGDLPKFNLDPLPQKKSGGLLRRGKLELEPVPELNIAGAIEAFLQHKLQFTPEYAGRSIHVHPAPGGGVAIEVDGRFFDAVGDVDDAEIRTFLQTTIQEWQQRH